MENVSADPIVVLAEGEMYGESGEEACAKLQNMLFDKSAGWLMIPFAPPVKAYFTKFVFGKDSSKNRISYTAEFTQAAACGDSRRQFNTTVANDGENAFQIANRCGVSVNDIMKLNDFRSPFDIAGESKVVIR